LSGSYIFRAFEDVYSFPISKSFPASPRYPITPTVVYEINANKKARKTCYSFLADVSDSFTIKGTML